MTAALAISKLQLRIIRNDPWFLLIMFLMPMVVMPLFVRTLGLGLAESGFNDATGAEVVVPGQVVLFGFFVGGSTAFALYREHGWKTWDRLRASAAPSRSLLAGFAMPWIAIHFVYQIVLFVGGGIALGLRFNGGSPLALVMMAFGYSACIISLVLLVSASFRTINQVNAFQNVGGLGLGGLGGALVPLEQLPDWAQAIAPITPQYWAMTGFRRIFLESGGVRDVVVPFAVLMATAALLGLIAANRFRADETKEFFA